MTTYQATLEYLYSQLPVFEKVGAHAYKPGLERCEQMDAMLGHPHRRFRAIHVAGTNGKGSTCHLLASVLQSAGLRVGLFTSPHLLDFGERIRVDGEPIDPQYVVDWVQQWVTPMAPLQPSFFELATMMAFSYFAHCEVDVAVIEVGLGGRLDSTNIIHPVLSVITNIALDHTQLLGDTLPQIAAEKAGIMKAGVTCVVGECTDERVRFTFQQNARLHEVRSLVFADSEHEVLWVEHDVQHGTPMMRYLTRDGLTLHCPLTGSCQPHNANTVLAAIKQLRYLDTPLADGAHAALTITDEAIVRGFADVLRQTHLRGRWETLRTRPDGTPQVICDTGHNPACFAYLGPALSQMLQQEGTLHVVMGMVADKDQASVVALLPEGAQYYWCQPDSPRALPAAQLADIGRHHHLHGEVYATIGEALDAAMQAAHGQESVFVGGSNFVVCEAMRLLPNDHG